MEKIDSKDLGLEKASILNKYCSFFKLFIHQRKKYHRFQKKYEAAQQFQHR